MFISHIIFILVSKAFGFLDWRVLCKLPVETDVAMGSVQTMHVFSALTVVSVAGGAIPPSRDPPEARFTLRWGWSWSAGSKIFLLNWKSKRQKMILLASLAKASWQETATFRIFFFQTSLLCSGTSFWSMSSEAINTFGIQQQWLDDEFCKVFISSQNAHYHFL